MPQQDETSFTAQWMTGWTVEHEATEALEGSLTREAERSLWVHRVIAGRMATDVEGVLAHALRNLERKEHAGRTSQWLTRWKTLLNSGPDAVFEVLTSRSPEAIELRQNTPFAGVLTSAERWAVRRQFARHWERQHAKAAR